MTAVGFEPTQLALVELESTPLDRSGKLSMLKMNNIFINKQPVCFVQVCISMAFLSFSFFFAAFTF